MAVFSELSCNDDLRKADTGRGWEVRSKVLLFGAGGLGHVADSETSNISHLEEPILISTQRMKAKCF